MLELRSLPATAPLRLTTGWTVSADPGDRGRADRWFDAERPDARAITVPGVIQQVLPDQHGVFWYYLRFRLAAESFAGQVVQLRFGAVDYLSEVWLNGQRIGGHEGAETPFVLDATSALARSGDQLLAMRVVNPDLQVIDGLKLAEIACRNKSISTGYAPGAGYNFGGILLPVDLAVVPRVRVADLWVRAEADSGRILATITVANDTDAAVSAALRLHAAPSAEGSTLAEADAVIAAAPGTSEHEIELTIPNVRRWNLEDPHLYRITATLDSPEHRHDASVRTGFRDLRIVDGFFHLNGTRIFLRSSHTGNHFPIGQIVPMDPDLMRRDLLMAKASGFNTVRFIAGMPYPEQLDYCDEIGLMVYEENLSAWLLGDSPQLGSRFDLALREMILRDRNHPCVTIWGLLNETPPNTTFLHAVASLPLLRSLDPTRLVLLSSGRWDGKQSIGSASNPGSAAWDPVWGSEGPGAPDIPFKLSWEPAGGYLPGVGDSHIYPATPLTRAHEALIRGQGVGTKPVFLSEFGVGSQFNAVEELKGFDTSDVPANLPDRAYIRAMVRQFETDWKRWGCDRAYPFPEDFLRDSSLQMARQRRNGFDLIRSNPQLCGYNLTGLLDHALTGEGMWSFWRRWKPGSMDVLQDGWAPLRWCLFVSERHAYAGRTLEIEAVMADESRLLPGRHPARLRIFSRGRGTVWERAVEITIPAGDPTRRALAVPVLKTTLDVPLEPGDYVFAACLESGGIAAADRISFRVSAPPQPLAADRCELSLIGVPASAEAWLTARGFRCSGFAAGSSSGVVLVGEPTAAEATEATWSAIRARADAGATVLFLSAAPFLAKDAPHPLGEEVTARGFHDWLYHLETVAKPSPIFDGLIDGGGLVDWDVFGQVMGHSLFTCRDASEPVAAAFTLGYPCPTGYLSGQVVTTIPRGRGRVMLNGFRVLEHLDQHPAADRLFLNLIRAAKG